MEAETDLGVVSVFNDVDANQIQKSDAGYFDGVPSRETLYPFFLPVEVPKSYPQISLQNLNKNTILAEHNTHLGLDFAEEYPKQSSNVFKAHAISLATEPAAMIGIQTLIRFLTIYGAFVGAVALVWHAPNRICLTRDIAVKIIGGIKVLFLKRGF